MGVIMNPQTGAVLAMASVPSFDNNNFSKYPIDNHRCRVITDQFEPGSTFKIVAATAALAEKKINLTEEFNCENGQFNYFGTSIKDHEPYGYLTTSQIIQHSSNIGIIKIAEKVGSSSMYKYARLFGFGSATNIGLEGETPGKIKPEKDWSRISVGQISMGHEIAVNTLQLATAFSAIANDGYIVKPHIVKRIYGLDEKTKLQNSTSVKRKIATEDIIIQIKKMLRTVVISGTGTEANIPGWEVAGKTGTAQKYIDGKYSNDHFISNFVGFLPSSNPKILSAIVLDEPESPMHWGGQGAAVAFRRIMQRLINMDDSIVPPLKNHKNLSQEFLSSEIIKSKEQFKPLPMSLSTINIEKNIRVPNVIGKSLKSAIKDISEAGLRLKISGSGQVISQIPRPGQVVKKNDVCLLNLR
jgi:cell division protein FtsI (penicillin-binding protein 3)